MFQLVISRMILFVHYTLQGILEIGSGACSTHIITLLIRWAIFSAIYSASSGWGSLLGLVVVRIVRGGCLIWRVLIGIFIILPGNRVCSHVMRGVVAAGGRVMHLLLVHLLKLLVDHLLLGDRHVDISAVRIGANWLLSRIDMVLLLNLLLLKLVHLVLWTSAFRPTVRRVWLGARHRGLSTFILEHHFRSIDKRLALWKGSQLVVEVISIKELLHRVSP